MRDGSDLPRFKRALPLAGLLSFFVVACAPSLTQTAIANGDTRTIRLFHVHTKESIDATYRVNGQYDAAVLKQLNWFLRDWRRDEPTTMDPRLFDTVWEVYRSAGAGNEPVTVMSAYRSPETNAMLRRRSRAVAEYSQHMMGKAMDTAMPGLSMEGVREVGMKLQRGGVGYYPSAGTPFVHLDVGSVRSWPRMQYDQLVRLFPDGKTVHLPSNGQPLARYEEARAEIAAYGSVAPPSSSSGNFFAWLFGRGGGKDGSEDEDTGAVVASRAPVPGRGNRGLQTASLAPRTAQTAPTSANPDDAGRDYFAAQAYRTGVSSAPPTATARPVVAQAGENLPKGETYLGPSATPTGPQPRTVTASLEAMPVTTPTAPDIGSASADHPAPPRRPAELLASLALPLPPLRPLDLIRKAIPAAISASATAYASLGSVGRRSPIDSVLDRDATGAIRSSDRTGTASGRPVTVTRIAPLTGSRSVRASVSPDALPPTVPARLDRSNFRAMTGGESTARATTQTIGGPTLTAPRAAARAGTAILAPVSSSTATSFGARATDLATGSFTPDAPLAQRN